MKIGLVGYFGFGNYGDELFVEVYRRAFAGHEVTVLGPGDVRGCHDAKEVAAQDAIIIGGGDLLITDRYVGHYWDPVLLTKPVFVAGVGVDFRRTPDPAVVERLATFFRHPHVNHVSTREERSRRWIADNLQPRCPTQVHADLVASLHFSRVPSITPTLGIVIRANETVDERGYRNLLEAANRRGYDTKTIVLGVGATLGEDLATARRLAVDGEVVTRDSIEALTTELAGCDVLVSQRFHGCLVAMLMGIPTVGLLDSEKFTALFRHTGLPGNIMDLGHPRLALITKRIPQPARSPRIYALRAGARRGVEGLHRAVLSHQPPRTGRRRQTFDGSWPSRDGFLTARRDWISRQKERSPRLIGNPAAALDPPAELAWYRKEIRRHKGRRYAETLDRLIDWTSELRDLPADTGAIVAIPVAGAAEHNHIYGTLSLYAQQDPAALGRTVVLTYVNYPADVQSDRTRTGRLQMTLHQIEAARIDFPQLRIATVEEPFDPGLPGHHGGIIGYIGRRLYDLALMTVERAYRAGRLDSAQAVLLIRNDADAIGMSRCYVQRLLSAAADHPETDIFQGTVRWGTDHYRDYPGYGVAMAFKEALRALTLRPGVRYRSRPGTSGTNVAVRVSTLAAVGGVGNSAYYGAGGDDVEIGLRVMAARGGATASGRRPIRYVAGTQIDAAGERPLATYRNGRTIVETWDTFNSGRGGYTHRGQQPDEHLIGPERFDDDGVVDRIERNFNALTQGWYTDRALVDTALRCIVGSTDEKGRAVYKLHTTGDRTVVTFTPAGRRWIAHRLSRSRSGADAPYGRRIRRALYGEAAGNGTKRPRMVSAL